MKSILFVLDYYIPHRWGVENVFENIIKRLEKKWYKIFVLTSKFDSKLKDFGEFWNVKIYRIGNGRLSFMRKAIWKWKEILKNNNIDVIHGSTYGWAIPAAILGKKFGKKVILTVHEIFRKLWYKYKWIVKWFIYKLFEKIIFEYKYDIYHCVSYNTQKDLINGYKINKDKTRVIHNWVDYEFWNPDEVKNYEIKSLRTRENWWNDFVFLYFGHAGKSKWIDYLVQALSELVKVKNTKFVFNIIDSKRSKKILEKIGNIGWNVQVFNWMTKNELRTMVASCDCIIAPSISEWFGSVHTETCAMGKMLITSNIPVLKEVVWWKVRFIKPGSSKEIVKSVKDVMAGKYENISMKKFDWDETVKQVEKLY